MKLSATHFLLIAANLLLAGYLVMAFARWNKPDESRTVCETINIHILDNASNAFIDEDEVITRLREGGVYPMNRNFTEISSRKIEEYLLTTPFVRTADCYKAPDGSVNISITQRMPILHVKALNGDDYYVDDNDTIMPPADCTADLIVATGNISPDYAQTRLSPFTRAIMENPFARNLVLQINVTGKQGIELITRIDTHVVYLGPLPDAESPDETQEQTEQKIAEFVERKFDTLQRFYQYGLKDVGWNVYSDINIEYDNQIICKREKAEQQ